MENFLRGHVAAFTAWDGCPRVLLYDNLKSAVLERQGDAIRFHPTLLAFAAHYRYEPRPVAVARGNEKGRVERAIRYVRDTFFAARTFADLDDLNAQAEAWCRGLAADRPCPGQTRSACARPSPRKRPLLALPDNPYPLVERVAVKVGKTPYVRFDLNDYSVPHTHVQRLLTVLADPHEVRIVDGAEVLACHPRSYDKGAQIEDAAHIQALVEHKRAARQHRGTDRLAQAAPASQTLLMRAAERGDNLGAITAALLRLLDRYGAAELEAAIREALERDVPHPNAVRLALERRREQRDEAPPVAVDAARACPGARCPRAAASARNLRPAQGAIAMSDLDALHARAKALNLHGLLAHWSEVAARRLGRAAARLGGAGARPPQPGAPAAHRPYRPLQAALRLRLELAQALRPRRHRGADDARLPQRRHQRRPGRPQRRRQVDARPNIAHQALIHGHTVLFTSAGQMLGDLAALDSDSALRRRLRHYARPQPPGHRRGRLSLLLQPPRRPAVRARLAAATRTRAPWSPPTARSPNGARSSPTPPASSPWSTASSTTPRSSPSRASPTASRKPTNAPSSAPANAAEPSHDQSHRKRCRSPSRSRSRPTGRPSRPSPSSN